MACEYWCDGGYPVDYIVVLLGPTYHLVRQGICEDCLRYQAEFTYAVGEFISVKKVEK